MCGAPCSLPLALKHFKGTHHGTRFCFALLCTSCSNTYWVSCYITQEMRGWSRNWANKLPVFICYDIINVSSTIFKMLSDKLEAMQIDAVIRRGKICLWWDTIRRNHKVRRFGFRFSLGYQYHSSMSEKQDLSLTSARHYLRLAFLGRTLLLTWNNCDYSNKTALHGRDDQPCLFRRPAEIPLQSSLQHISPRLLIASHRRCFQTV